MKDDNKTKKQLIQELTELRSQDAELKKSESAEKYRSLVENIRDIIYELDSQGVVLYISPAIRDMLGFDSAEIVGKNFIEIAHKDDQSSLAEWFSELRKGKEYPSEYRVINKSGEFKWAQTRTRPIMEDGLFKGARGILIDLTAQRRVEEELKKKESFNYALFEYNPEQTIAVDLEGKVIAVNQAKRISGDRLPNIGDVMYRDYASDHEIDMYSELMECLGSGKLKVFTEQKYREKILSISMAPFSEGAVIISKDITKRKRAEEALQESEKRFRELAELLPETVYEADAQGRLTFLNRNAFDRFGYTQQDFADGLNVFDMVTPDGRGRALENTQRIMNGGKIGSNELTMRRKDGSTFPSMIHSTAIIQGGKPVGLRGFIVDITERKRAEEALRESERRMKLALEGTDQGLWEWSGTS